MNVTEPGGHRSAKAKDADLEKIAARVSDEASAKVNRPVHLWDPPDFGPISIKIKRGGTWWHEGRPIMRPRMVALFASILRREGDAYYLVTPVEKWQIEVEDVPFLAVEMWVEGKGRQQKVTFRTQCGDVVSADSEHPIRVETNVVTGEPSPYVAIRNGLEARIARSVFYDLVELAEEVVRDHKRLWGVWSCSQLFFLGEAPIAEVP